MEGNSMSKSFKKIISLIFVMVCVPTLFGTAAFAAETSAFANEDILDEVDKTNDYIYKTISKIETKAESEVLKASQNIQKEEALDESIDKLCEKLVEQTEKKADKLIEKAAEDGIEISIGYTEVEIYDRIVLVDPCYAH
jgi:hypothetical protein